MKDHRRRMIVRLVLIESLVFAVGIGALLALGVVLESQPLVAAAGSAHF